MRLRNDHEHETPCSDERYPYQQVNNDVIPLDSIFRTTASKTVDKFNFIR